MLSSGFKCFKKVKVLVFEGLILFQLKSLGKFLITFKEYNLN